MAENRDRRREDDEEDQQQKEKKKLSIKPLPLAVAVLGVIVLLQGGALLYLLLGDREAPEITAIVDRLDQLEQQNATFSSRLEDVALIAKRAEILEERFDRTLDETDFNNFRAVRALLIEQELSYQQFLGALQQGMFELSRMVKGSRTWYDVYKEELDRVIQGSKKRVVTLRRLTPRN